MHIYNITVAGGFALVILFAGLFPDFRRLISWNGFDPITVSLIVPLFLSMAFFSIISLGDPEKGKAILWMQVFYKPIAIALIAFFAVRGMIHPVWAAITITGLLVYIAGNLTALLWKNP